MKLPFSSRTTISFVTRSTWTRNVGFCCVAVVDAGGCAGGCAGVCADRPAARATHRAVDQNPFIFKLIRVLDYTSRRARRAVRVITVVAASVAASPATRIAEQHAVFGGAARPAGARAMRIA